MATQLIERADEMPLVLSWLRQMHVAEIMDRLCSLPPTKWQGLREGPLAGLCSASVVHRRTHRLWGLEAWLGQQRSVLEPAPAGPSVCKTRPLTAWAICGPWWEQTPTGSVPCNGRWGNP